MSMVTPTLNLPQPASSAATAKAAAPAAPSVPVAAPAPAPAPAPSTTVTLSPQALSAMAASHAAASSTAASGTPAAAPAPQGGSVYESLKNGISTAFTDVGDAIASGAHAVVDGVETALSTANKVATGIVELPFAAVAKASDAVGALIDEL